MNILFANEYFVPFAPGGAEWSMYYWIQILADRGHRIAVSTPDLSDGTTKSFEEDEGLRKYGEVAIHRFPFRKNLPVPPRVFPSYFFGNPVFTKYFAGRILKTAAGFNPDVLFAQGYDAIPAVAEAGMRAGIPAVCTIRDYRIICPVSICLHHRDYAPAHCTCGDFHRCLKDYYSDYGFPAGLWGKSKAAGRRLLEWRNMRRVQAALKKLDGAVFVSEGIQRIYRRAQRIPGIAEVVYNPLPDSTDGENSGEVLKRYDLQEKQYLLFVGRFSIGKGAEVLAKAMPLIRKEIPGAVVAVAGNREYETAAEGLKFHGHVDRRSMAALYSTCRAVVLPSRWQEPFSRVLLEAARYKIPLIATRAGGNPEMVEDGLNGLLVPRNDPVALADACVRMLRMDPAAWREMAHQAHLRGTERFNNETLAENMESFLNRVVSRGME